MKHIIFMLMFLPALLIAGPIEDLKPGEWCEVPNSHLEDAAPSPRPDGNSGPRAVIDAWGGGAYDTKRDRLYCWGGGHGDYSGNEIYAFDINTFSWSIIWGPTLNSQIPSGGGNYETYGDGNPGSRHTGAGLQYIPDPVDAFFDHGGALWSSGANSNACWQFNFSDNQWHRKANGPGSAGPVCMETAYDSVTGHVFSRNESAIGEYNPVTGNWTGRKSLNVNTWKMTAEIDPIRRKMIFVGDSKNSNVTVFNLTTSDYTTQPTTGDKALESAYAPGLAYDPVSGKMIGYNGGAAVYSLDLDSWNWTRHSPASTNTVTPSAACATGTYNRFRYIPSRNVFIVVNSGRGNVYFYKFADDPTTLSKKNVSIAPRMPVIAISPNPFNVATKIQVSGSSNDLRHFNKVNLIKVYDINGKCVNTLSDYRTEGSMFQFKWNANRLPSGIYVLKVKWDDKILSKKIILK